jgi:hypothetical protein
MEINRNQYFMAGLVIFLLGVQLRNVESYVLKDNCSQFIEKRLVRPKPAAIAATSVPSFFGPETQMAAPSKRSVRPPKWLGFALLSAGAVLVFHSLAMKRPD